MKTDASVCWIIYLAVVCHGAFAFYSQQYAADTADLTAGYFGCRFSRSLCGYDEECVDDGLFGNCQKSVGGGLLPDVYQYELSGSQRAQLESILLKLIGSGYTWSHQYTQCVIANVLLAYRSGVDFDLGFCTSSLFPPGHRWTPDSSDDLVVPSWLTEGQNFDGFPRGIPPGQSLEEQSYMAVPPDTNSQQVKDVEEFLEGLSSEDLDQLKKYVVDDLTGEEVLEHPAESEETDVVRRFSEDDIGGRGYEWYDSALEKKYDVTDEDLRENTEERKPAMMTRVVVNYDPGTQTDTDEAEPTENEEDEVNTADDEQRQQQEEEAHVSSIVLSY